MIQKAYIFLTLLTPLFFCCNSIREVQNEQAKETATVTTDEQTETKKITDSLFIQGNNIWVRSKPKTGDVVMKLNQDAFCQIHEAGILDTIRGHIDHWYKIENNEQIGWVYGSQTSKRLKANEETFPIYLEYVLNTIYQNILMKDKFFSFCDSSTIYQFTNENIGFYRSYNPGLACIRHPLKTQHIEDKEYHGLLFPINIDLTNIRNEQTLAHPCDESKDHDAIDYYLVKQLPIVYNMELDKMEEISLPNDYKDCLKIKVDLINKNILNKSMYFILVKGNWYWVFVDDCDCSA